MKNKNKKFFLTKMKLLISTGLLCTSLNVNAAVKKGPVKVVGNPKYAKDLIYDFDRVPYEIDRFIRDNDIDIYFLPYENSAEELYWQKNGSSAPGDITGFTFMKDYDSKKEIDVYVEAGMKSGYYENNRASSDGLTKEEFNYRVCRGTLMHEIGHALDATQDYTLSNNVIFRDIYRQEKDKFKWTEEYNVENVRVDANINSVEEYFATSFGAFICHPGDLYRKCPLTYCYMDAYAKEIASKYIDSISEIEEKYSDSIVKDHNLLRNNYKILTNNERKNNLDMNKDKKNNGMNTTKKYKPKSNYNKVKRLSPRR